MPILVLLPRCPAPCCQDVEADYHFLERLHWIALTLCNELVGDCPKGLLPGRPSSVTMWSMAMTPNPMEAVNKTGTNLSSVN